MRLYNTFYAEGKWQACHADKLLDVINPYSEEVIGQVLSCTDADISTAVSSAREAFVSWSQTSVSDRVDLLRKAAAAMKSRATELGQVITSELGMPLRLTQRIQVASPIATFELTAQALSEFSWEENVSHSLVTKEPVGVVAAITPWNYPLHQIAAKVAPAMASGCTVVLKPSEITPLNALLFAEILDAVGIPPGVFNLVLGSGSDVGEALVRHEEVDFISFTGSTSVGKRVMELGAQSVKRVRLELGGKSPSVVLQGADLARAIKATINSCFMNSGQTCSALTRLIVSEQDYAKTIELAVSQAGSFVLGDPLDERTKLGPLVSSIQRDRVRNLITKGLDEGATLLAGGVADAHGTSQGFFVAPTILGDVDINNVIGQKEIFGPVLSILTYRDVDHAVEIANSTSYGLSGAVWGADQDTALRTARRIRSGQIDINGAPFNMLAPFGGFKQSGFGRELGRFGIDEYVEFKSYQYPLS